MRSLRRAAASSVALPWSPAKRSSWRTLTAPSSSIRLHSSMHGAGQTRPQTAGKGEVRSRMASASSASSRARAWRKPRTSLPAGQTWLQGGTISCRRGWWVAHEPVRMAGAASPPSRMLGTRAGDAASGRGGATVAAGWSSSRVRSWAWAAAARFGPPKPECSRAARTSSSSKPRIRPAAPASAVLTIGTLRVPRPLSRAMAVASTVASR